MNYFVHETAVVDEGAQIGRGTRIWHFCHVMPTARIGAHCSFGQNVFVADNVEIGDNVKIQNNVSVYEGVELEKDVFCGPSVVFTNVRTPRSAVPRNTSEDYDRTLVRRGATLGANCTVVCGVTIGEHALIGAGAVVTADVQPHALMLGVPARQTGWACQCGSTLVLPLDAERPASSTCSCGCTYRLDGAGLTLEEAATEESTTPPRSQV